MTTSGGKQCSAFSFSKSYLVFWRIAKSRAVLNPNQHLHKQSFKDGFSKDNTIRSLNRSKYFKNQNTRNG